MTKTSIDDIYNLEIEIRNLLYNKNHYKQFLYGEAPKGKSGAPGVYAEMVRNPSIDRKTTTKEKRGVETLVAGLKFNKRVMALRDEFGPNYPEDCLADGYWIFGNESNHEKMGNLSKNRTKKLAKTFIKRLYPRKDPLVIEGVRMLKWRAKELEIVIDWRWPAWAETHEDYL